MTPDELVRLLRDSDFPEPCLTSVYVDESLQKSDAEIYATIAEIDSFWDRQYA